MVEVEDEQNQPYLLSSKRSKIDEILEEDRISTLPDHLLLRILSRLPSTKDAIRTGKLSKRWKSLWTSIPTLAFDISAHDQSMPDFASIINRTLTQCRHTKLNRFQICLDFEHQLINEWIRYAVSRNVEELYLTFYNFEPEVKWVLEEQFFVNSCFTRLKLECCIFDPKGAISWKRLRSLCVFNVRLDEDLIENILLGSPVLETLELESCYGYKRLDITSKSLKKLMFSGYNNYKYCDPTVDDDDVGGVKVIEINAPSILSLEIDGCLLFWKFLLLDVSSLVEAGVYYQTIEPLETEEEEEESLKVLITSLQHVKELEIGGYCSTVFSRLVAKGFPSLSNVKFLDDTSIS